MRIQDILKKNGLWILISSLCSVVISRSVIVGTDAITEQMDVLITSGTLNIVKILWVVLPAITIATIASFAESKCIGKYSVKVIKEIQDIIAQSYQGNYLHRHGCNFCGGKEHLYVTHNGKPVSGHHSYYDILGEYPEAVGAKAAGKY